MKIVLKYKVKLGKYDNNDDEFDYEVLTPDEATEKAYKRAVLLGDEFEDVPELEALCGEVYRELEQAELEKLHEQENMTEFANDCFAKGKNPFECGYKLKVWVAEDVYVPDDDDIEEALREALAAGDLETAYAIGLEQEENYSGSIIEAAFRIAEEVGCQEFLEQNKRD